VTWASVLPAAATGYAGEHWHTCGAAAITHAIAQLHYVIIVVTARCAGWNASCIIGALPYTCPEGGPHYAYIRQHTDFMCQDDR